MKILIVGGITAVVATLIGVNYLARESPESRVEHRITKNGETSEAHKLMAEVKGYRQSIDASALQEKAYDAVSEKQDRLVAALSRIEKKLTQLNSRIDKIEAEQIQADKPEVAPVEQPESFSYTDGGDSRQEFVKEEDAFYAQGFDPVWDAEMAGALSDVESTISTYSDGGVVMSAQECRSDGCRVEFTHQRTDAPLHPVMLAAKGSSRMLFDSVTEDGLEKTIVIYKR